QLLSEGGGPICDGLDETGESCLATEHVEGCYYYCTGLAGCTAKTGEHDATCLSLCVSAELAGECRALRHKQDCVEYCKGAAEVGKCPAVGAHKPGCIESCTESDGSADCPATGAHKDTCLERCDRTESCFATLHHYEDCLALCDKSSTCPALNHKTGCYMAGLTYKAYAVRVKQVGLTELIVAADVQTVYTLSTGSKGWVLEDPKAINNELMITERVVAVSNPSGYKEGDILLFWTGYQGETKVNSGIARYAAGSGSGMNGMGGMSGFGGFGGFGAFGGFGGMAGGSGSQGEDNLFSLDEQVLLTVTDHSSMTLTITLDEHDISSIYLGQKAQVKITALRGQTFEGTVTDIGMEGTNNGGNSKFTVDLELPWNESMLAGMNATATISLETRTGVVRIPVAALVEDRAGTVVYTAVDPDTGELANPVAVTTGVSDGEYVQILSGLELGDTVYYSYYDTLELDHTAKPNTASMFG
ncbi:MAG: HlyD family efflux transporter periplasmic adaptor subunit, partial [Oscillospiraceae bacterium]|nr:HlyD family efflux transporter periplasmic adaptor subunit [Oscillospiraceae bacterium]